ncbi:helix-turn-helix protein [Herbihabitans rhizosphaerae]|uniref:Helix-turn-helix protein n=1 Tax=Herbihabitans rhizosphaerae TaxID=1872711 RepID=A0A4Q7L4L3_9PSEU|nr:helix-turn-helix transcriptional regulator [Herbihabitans rhizosphaerae]RZS44207.1 helix-turn-helix protein [Herbihabitans rhizosphaerae]
MSGQGAVPFRRRRFGKKLREMREAANKTLEEAAEYLDMSRSALQRWESDETQPNINVVRSMMDLYDCRLPNILEEVRAVRQAQGGGLGYVDAEEEADATDQLHLLYVPGLLQTESYMRALFALAFPPYSPEEIDVQIVKRLKRPDRLVSVERPLELVALIDETALRIPMGGPEVMGEQLRHIVTMASLSTITVQVIPLARGGHSGMRSDFSLLKYPYPDCPEILFAPIVNNAKLEYKEEAIRDARRLFDHVRTQALGPDESVELITQLADDLYGA